LRYCAAAGRNTKAGERSIAFDVLHSDGQELLDQPSERRRETLEAAGRLVLIVHRRGR
jgi:ATP-dependent DNA ligase